MGVMNDLFANDPSAHQSVMLAGAADLDGFRQHARRLLASGITPGQVSWFCCDNRTADLFGVIPLDTGSSPSAAPLETTTNAGETAPTQPVPAGFLELCKSVILHNDPQRFGLLYRLLWRLVHEPGLRHDPLDADRIAADHLAQAVHRDMHKMKAFIRFRTVQDEIFKNYPEGGLLHVAWFEPEHHIVEAITPFFARRFTQMRWAILTPERCVEWDGSVATFSPGANESDAPPADAGEQLWLTYYQHIFNPARLKLKMMQKEMPRKYWRNLPEAQLISRLTADAPARHMAMIEAEGTTPARRIPLFRASAAASARKAGAGNSASLDLPGFGALNAAIGKCRDCPIGEHATQAVCAEGPEAAHTMVVGEQPGDQEDLQGRPFVGPAGQLFDRALADLSIDRSQLFVTNAVKHFKYEPRGKRRIHKTPSQREASICAQWLEREIALVKPRVALALGATAAFALMGRRISVTAERGQWLTRPDGLRVVVTLHPAALLRMEPVLRDEAYAAWLKDLRIALVDEQGHERADTGDGTKPE